MNYFYQYELTASVLLIILLWLYYMKKNYPTKTNKIYLNMVKCCLISSVFDLISIFTGRYPQALPIWLIYVINMVYLAAYNGAGILFYNYVLAAAKKNETKRRDEIICVLVIIIDAIIIFSSPLTHFAFKINEHGEYSRGPLMLGLYATSFALLISIIYIFIRYKLRLIKIQRYSIIFFVVLTISSALIQLFWPEQLISNLVSAIFLVLLYMSLQNPDDYINNLTNCFNESAFNETIEKNIAKEIPFYVVAFVPDDFVYIKQYLGVEAGNELIGRVADFLLGRYGRESVYYISDGCFAVISNESVIYYDVVYSDIMEFFGQPFKTEGMEMTITPYVCIVKYPDFVSEASDVRDAIEYSFKQLRKNKDANVLVASSKSLELKKREDNIVRIMKRALSEEEFDVYYQPIYDIKDECFSSAEALIRLYDEELGFISPEEFIPLAERNGMIIKIGELVFRKVCAFLKNNPIKELGVSYIEVNLSVVQCMQDNLTELMLGIMAEYGVTSNSINFEITETASSINDKSLRRNMKLLIEKGISFSMDDYGTGYSNINNLISLPMDLVKIDKGILWSAMKDEEAFVILWHTVQMIKELKKEVVVEGVETEQMKNILTEMGCDHLQGYLFSKPVPEKEYVEFLRRQKGL